MKLTVKQQRFADYYIELGNATEAAIKAGYSRSYANAQSYKLLENVGIKAYIEKRMEELQSERVADQQEVMEFLTAVMRGEVEEPIPLLNGEGYQRIVNVQPSAQTRRSAAVDIGKRYGMWTEKQLIDVQGAVTFVDDIGAEEDGP